MTAWGMTRTRLPQTRSGQGFARARLSGFTLIELVVTIAVAGVLLAIAVPSFKSTLLNGRRSAAVNDFVGAITTARASAVSRHASVVMCHSASPSAAIPVCSTAGGWQEGWIVFDDRDGDGTVNSSTDVIRVHEMLPSGTTINGQTAVVSKIAFSSFGIAVQVGNLAICDSRGWTTDARVITINTAGRIRTFNQADSAGTGISSCTP